MRRIERRDAQETGLFVQLVRNNKVFKTHKGGKTASWSALVVVGDRNGKVGVGIGKARGVPDAIRKGEEAGRRAMISVPMIAGTIPHDVRSKMGATLVWLKPASPGTGVIAGASVRAVCEAAGISDTQQVGYAYLNGQYRAGLWTNTTASWVDLTPAGATEV